MRELKKEINDCKNRIEKLKSREYKQSDTDYIDIIVYSELLVELQKYFKLLDDLQYNEIIKN